MCDGFSLIAPTTTPCPCSSIPLWPGPHGTVVCRLYHPGYLASWLLGFRHWDLLAGDQRGGERQRSGYFLPMLTLFWCVCRWLYLSIHYSSIFYMASCPELEFSPLLIIDFLPWCLQRLVNEVLYHGCFCSLNPNIHL